MYAHNSCEEEQHGGHMHGGASECEMFHPEKMYLRPPKELGANSSGPGRGERLLMLG